MRIEFSAWPGNMEIKLIEVLDGYERVRDSFYTSAKEVRFSGEVVNAESLMVSLEDLLPPPTIGGEWGKFHPYWAEREAKKKGREERGMQASETDPHREHD